MRTKHCSHGRFCVDECDVCSKRTPTPAPWELLPVKGSLAGMGSYVIRAEKAPGGIAVTIGGLGDEEKANAELIVHAVNSHEESNEIKTLLLKAKERFDQGLPLEYSALINKAIAKAEARL